jgi:thiamine biosynthesis protein ThiS
MELIVNGKPRQVESPLSLLDLLQSLGVDPRIVAVEHNGEIVKRDHFEATPLQSGDRLEVVRMVGGG